MNQAHSDRTSTWLWVVKDASPHSPLSTSSLLALLVLFLPLALYSPHRRAILSLSLDASSSSLFTGGADGALQWTDTRSSALVATLQQPATSGEMQQLYRPCSAVCPDVSVMPCQSLRPGPYVSYSIFLVLYFSRPVSAISSLDHVQGAFRLASASASGHVNCWDLRFEMFAFFVTVTSLPYVISTVLSLCSNPSCSFEGSCRKTSQVISSKQMFSSAATAVRWCKSFPSTFLSSPFLIAAGANGCVRVLQGAHMEVARSLYCPHPCTFMDARSGIRERRIWLPALSVEEKVDECTITKHEGHAFQTKTGSQQHMVGIARLQVHNCTFLSCHTDGNLAHWRLE